MKQKVIVKLCIADEKSRKKAMKCVVGHSGVQSASLQEKDKNQIEVVGEGIDSVVITSLLRKCLGFAELVSVNPIEEKKKDGGGEDKSKVQTKDNHVVFVPPPPFYGHYPYYNGGGYGCVEYREDPSCNIM